MEKDSKIQVKKEHYDFNKYVGLARRNSYYHQIEQVCKCNGNSVLLIGIGDGIVPDILKKIGKNVTTFDFDKSLNPDIVGDVTQIDEIITKEYDIIVCCQVLEHIPFEMFEPTIKRIHRIGKQLVLSLPNRNYRIMIFTPIIRHFKIRIRKFWRNSWNFYTDGDGEHYREIDATNNWRRKKINAILIKYYEIQDSFVPFNNAYHIFWRLYKK